MALLGDELGPDDLLAVAGRVRGPATAAIAALAANAVFYVVSIGFRAFQLTHTATGWTGWVDDFRALEALSSVLWIAGGLCFLQWVSSAFRAARQLGAVPNGFTSRSVNWGFLIPILNLFRPYQGLRALDAAIDPTLLPEPPPQPETDMHSGGYREAARAGAATGDVRRPPLDVWWSLWIAGMVLPMVASSASGDWTAAMVVDLMRSCAEAACAALAIVVVQRIGLRLTERARRLGAQRVVLARP